MNITWRLESGSKDITQVGEGEVAIANSDFRGKCYLCGKHCHTRVKCPDKKNNKEDKDHKEEEESKKFTGTFNHSNKAGHKAADCWKPEENNYKRQNNLKENGVKEVGLPASNSS